MFPLLQPQKIPFARPYNVSQNLTARSRLSALPWQLHVPPHCQLWVIPSTEIQPRQMTIGIPIHRTFFLMAVPACLLPLSQALPRPLRLLHQAKPSIHYPPIHLPTVSRSHLDLLDSINAPPSFHQIVLILRRPQLGPVVSPLRRSFPLIVISLDTHPILLIALLMAAPHRLPRMSAWEMRLLPILRLLSCDPRPTKIPHEWASDRRSLSSRPHPLPHPIQDTYAGACPHWCFPPIRRRCHHHPMLLMTSYSGIAHYMAIETWSMADRTDGASIAQFRVWIVRSCPVWKIIWAGNHVKYLLLVTGTSPYLLIAGLLSQPRLGDHVRVIREHAVERESVPSVFDVFNIGESSQDRNRPSAVREHATSRYTSTAGAYTVIEGLCL